MRKSFVMLVRWWCFGQVSTRRIFKRRSWMGSTRCCLWHAVSWQHSRGHRRLHSDCYRSPMMVKRKRKTTEHSVATDGLGCEGPMWCQLLQSLCLLLYLAGGVETSLGLVLGSHTLMLLVVSNFWVFLPPHVIPLANPPRGMSHALAWIRLEFEDLLLLGTPVLLFSTMTDVLNSVISVDEMEMRHDLD